MSIRRQGPPGHSEVERVVTMDVNPPPAWFLRTIEKHADRFTFVRGDVSQLEDLLDIIRHYSIDRLVNWAMVMSLDSLPRLNSTRMPIHINDARLDAGLPPLGA